MKVILVPKYLTVQELEDKNLLPDATVEAEYGGSVIKGSVITLAHHVKEYAMCPPPCCINVGKLSENAIIVVSHVDLDTVGGCLALMGKKPENDEFWNGAGIIDCKGTHHIHELSPIVQKQLNAVYAWNEQNRPVFSNEITEVTDFILDFGEIIDKVLEGDKELLDLGKVWVREKEAKVQSCLIWENRNLRIFEIPDYTFCAAAYYSPLYGSAAKATLSYSIPKGTITVAFEDGGAEYSAKELVQTWWGDMAGGHPGIAGSPRGRKMTQADWKMAQERMKELFSQAERTDKP